MKKTIFTLTVCSLALSCLAQTAVSLPDGYTELEYIEANGTQYIDSGVAATASVAIEAVLATTPASGTSGLNYSGAVYGGSGGWIAIGGYNEDKLVSYFAKGSRNGTGVEIPYDNEFHYYFCGQGDQKIDDHVATTTASAFSASNLNIWLFAAKIGWNAAFLKQQKIKYFNIFQNGTAVRRYTPVSRKSDGAIGMYESCSGQFVANSGTGAFIAGPTVVKDNIRVVGLPENFGTPDPGYGETPSLTVGQEMTFTCPAAFTNDDRTVVASCAGWTLENMNGDVLEEGTATSVTLTITQAMLGGRLTWNWKYGQPVVTVLRAAQRYPWNGLIDIDYAVSRFEKRDEDYVVTLDVTIDGTTYRPQRFVQCAGCDLPTAEGVHRVTWNALADDVALRGAAVSVKATLAYSPVTEGMCDYAIIDVSGGSSSDSFPIRYVKGTDIPSDSFDVDIYKTTKIVLKRVPAQTTYIGCASHTGDGPEHYAKLTHDYLLGLFPVTQTQYKQVCGSNPSGHYTIGGQALTAAAVGMRPVEKVGWNSIMADGGFIARLNAKARYHGRTFAGYQLPTDAQWECACRAGTTTKYAFGSTSADLGDYAWYASNTTTTEPVGLKRPNQYGFYDMYGNVYEWVEDSYKAYASGVGLTPETAIEDPSYLVPASAAQKILRGGSRRVSPGTNNLYFPSGYRFTSSPAGYGNYNGDHTGFRLSKTLR